MKRLPLKRNVPRKLTVLPAVEPPHLGQTGQRLAERADSDAMGFRHFALGRQPLAIRQKAGIDLPRDHLGDADIDRQSARRGLCFGKG